MMGDILDRLADWVLDSKWLDRFGLAVVAGFAMLIVWAVVANAIG